MKASAPSVRCNTRILYIYFDFERTEIRSAFFFSQLERGVGCTKQERGNAAKVPYAGCVGVLRLEDSVLLETPGGGDGDDSARKHGDVLRYPQGRLIRGSSPSILAIF